MGAPGAPKNQVPGTLKNRVPGYDPETPQAPPNEVNLGGSNFIEGGFGAHFAPVLRLINIRKVSDAWNHKHIGSLSSAVCNRQWPQARLDTAGMAP